MGFCRVLWGLWGPGGVPHPLLGVHFPDGGCGVHFPDVGGGSDLGRFAGEVGGQRS